MKARWVAASLLIAGLLQVSLSAQEPADADRAAELIRRFETILERNPRRGTALDRVYGHHAQSGTLDELVARWRETAESGEANATAWMLVGLFESRRGNDAEAIESFRRAEEIDKQNPHASFYLAESLRLTGDLSAAAEAYQRAIERRPPRAELLDIYRLLGRTLQRSGREEDALGVWRQLEESFPGDVRVAEQIAAALAEDGQLEEARLRYERLAEAARQDLYRQVTYQIHTADLTLQLGDRDAALDRFEQVLSRLKPDSWLFKQVRGKIESVFRRVDDLAGLAEYYAQWIDAHPEDLDAMVKAAKVLSTLGRGDEAQDWYTKAIELAPSEASIRQAYIDQLVYDKKYAEAIEQYRKLSEVDPNNPDVLQQWGLVVLKDPALSENEQREKAAEVWMRLVDARPEDPVTIVQVADLLRQAQVFDKAEEHYRRAVELRPLDVQYREYLGEFLHSRDRRDEALSAWQKLAAGELRTPENLHRLAEVLRSFGFPEEALSAAAEARDAEPKELLYHLTYIELLLQAERFEDAKMAIATAVPLASDLEDREALMQREIRAHQGAETLDEAIAELQEQLAVANEGGQEDAATAERWLRLARFLDADRQMQQAVAAVETAVRIDASSITGHRLLAEFKVSIGAIDQAADAYRRLTTIDPQYRSNYLREIARLEARLGRIERALQAGQDLLASAPGNAEHLQFYADLCFQLGRSDEGLETLRRAVRTDPSDSDQLLRLAGALANQFQTAEAIELYWQAFEKAADLREQLTIVSRLAELHLQQNQFERLIARLDREAFEDGSDRAATFCIAQAHLQAEDYVAARDKLESYLADNEQDTLLLEQLSRIAEQEGDLDSAIEYQQRLAQIKTDAGEQRRLAQLLLKADQAQQAEKLLAELALQQDEFHQILESADELLAYERFEAAQQILSELARRHPQNWEVLYRQAVARGDTEAAIRLYERILALPLDHDEQSAAAKAAAAQRTATSQGSGVPGASQRREAPQWVRRVQYASQIRRTVGLDDQRYYVQPGQRPQFWAPSDYGAARMASMAWLLNLSSQVPDEKLDEQLAERYRFEAPSAAGQDGTSVADGFQDPLYFAAIKNDFDTQLQIARHISESGDVDACGFYLQRMMTDARRQSRVASRGEPVPEADPLPEDELAHLLECFRRVQESSGEPAASYVTLVMTELEHAGRGAEAKELLTETIDGIDESGEAIQALNLLASRGDMEGVVRMMKRAEELSRDQSSGRGRSSRSSLNYTLPQIFSQLADEEDFDALLDVLVAYLEWAEADRVAESRGYRVPSRQSGGRNYVNVYMGRGYRSVQLDFPAVSNAFDSTALTALRNAFEFMQQPEDLDRLTARLAEAAEGRGGLTHRLAVAYVDWWRGEKVAAVHALDKAIREGGGDEELQFQLAHALLAIGEPVAALEQLDGITTLDQASTVRRELAVLGLALQSGAIDRAREAAERLFGLRLGSDEQFQLARYMHQLGMHDMANAVLRRIRQSTRGASSEALNLMTAFEQQGKRDEALALAHQILRTRPPAQPTNNQHDQFRQQALQVIARLGDIKQLIAETEEKLEASPKSARLLKQLADYYQADNQRDEAREVYERLAELGPEDAHSRFQAAQMLESMGNRDAAIDHYVRAFELDPSLFSSNYYQIQRTFQQEKRLDDLAQVFLKTDISKLSDPYRFVNLVQALSQEEEHAQLAFELFEKIWDAHPQYRTYMLSSLRNDALQKLPRIYDYAREGVLAENTAGNSWQALEQIMSWSSDGTITSAPHILLNVAESQGKLEELEAEIVKAIEDRDGWPAGKALLGLVALRRKEVQEAKTIFDALLSERLDEVPAYAALILGNAMESEPKLRPWAARLYEQAMQDRQRFGGLGFDYGPEKRLVNIYKQEGRNREARELLLREALGPMENQHDPGYTAYQWLRQQAGIGEELVQLGFPLDALYVVNAARGNDDMLQMAERWGGQIGREFDQSATVARRQLKPETLLEYLARSAELEGAPPAPQEAGDSDADGRSQSSVDLLLYVSSENASGEQSIESPIVEIVRKLQADDPALADIEARLAKLADQEPTDVNVLNLWALVQMRLRTEAGDSSALDRLVEYIDSTPPPTAEPGRFPDEETRQRARAELGLCFAAHQCLAEPDRAEQGSALLDRAIHAAALLKERDMTGAMLRTSAKLAIERGDRDVAEEQLRQLLELLLGRETAQPPGTAAMPTGNRFSGVVRHSFLASSGPWLRPILLSLATQTAPANPNPSAEENQQTLSQRLAGRQRLRPVDLPTFRQIASLAELSADSGMHDLSLECIREALRGGPPIPATADELAMQSIGGYGGSGSFVVAIGSGGPNSESPQIGDEELAVANAITRLDDRWKRQEIAAEDVYETLLAVVLPEGRANEIFLYTAPAVGDEERQDQLRVVRPQQRSLFQTLFGGLKNNTPEEDADSLPDGVSLRLVRRAIEAEKVDDLRRRVVERAEQPLAAVPAHILLAHLGMEAGDVQLAEEALMWLNDRLAEDRQPHTAQVAALAAIPAVKSSEHFASGAQLAERIAEAAEFHNDGATAQQIKMILAQAVIAQGKSEEGLARLREVSGELLESLFQMEGDQQEIRRLAIGLCLQLAEEGDLSAALKIFGKLLDTTTPGHWRSDRLDVEAIPPVLLKSLAKLDPDAVYEHLADFVVPQDAARVRLQPWFFHYQPPPAHLATDAEHQFRQLIGDDNQFLPSDRLIEEARRLGKLDELARRTATLQRSRVPGAQELLFLVGLADGPDERVVEDWRQLAHQLQQNTDHDWAADPTQFWNAVIVARAGTLHENESIVRHASEMWRPLKSTVLGPNTVRRVRYLWASAEYAREKLDHQTAAAGSPLAHWVAAPLQNSERGGMARVPSIWVECDGIVRHVVGPENNSLLLKYPLRGTFQFSVDAYNASYGEGNVGYGTLQLELQTWLSQTQFHTLERVALDTAPFVPSSIVDVNRWTIDVSPERVRWLINGHVVRDTPPAAATSPWVGLFASGSRFTFFKNARITGDPQVPQEVPLIDGDSTEGWVTSILAQSLPPVTLGPPTPAGTEDAEFSWRAEDGVLYARRTSPDAAGLIEYHRPLVTGDEVRYEFFYGPGSEVIHPALGRMVLELRPDGARTRWLPNADPLSIGQETAAVREPADFGQIPTSPLPIKENEWNTVRLQVQGEKVLIAVNDEDVLRVEIAPQNTRRFGFYRPQDVAEARARNVSLRGEWSAALSEGVLADLFRPAEGESRPGEVAVIERVVGTEPWSLQAADVIRHAAGLPDSSRYEYLSTWVLPDQGETEVRPYAAFTTSPAAARLAGGEKPAATSRADDRLISPLEMLVKTAGRLDKVEEVRERVLSTQPDTEHAERSRQAALVLLACAQQDAAAAGEHLEQLTRLVERERLDLHLFERWPELVALDAAVDVRPLPPAAHRLVEVLREQLAQLRAENELLRDSYTTSKRPLSDQELFGRYVSYLEARLEQNVASGEGEPQAAIGWLDDWNAASRAAAWSHGLPLPPSTWISRGDAVQRLSHHLHDRLYYRLPLAGDFELVCEAQGLGEDQIRLGYDGIAFGVGGDGKSVITTDLGGVTQEKPLDEPIADDDRWHSLRLVATGEKLSYWFDDRQLHEVDLEEGRDPWLFLFASGDGKPRFRNVQVTGEPAASGEISLLASPRPGRWSPYYVSTISPDSGWTISSQAIGGRMEDAQRERRIESLLYYHAPMFASGEIAYEFHYAPERALAHPCIGRTALLLAPDGVQVHQITDAQYEQNGLDPHNVSENAEARLNDGPLPLKPDEWNTLVVRFDEDAVTLALNGQDVYRHTLPADDVPRFGIFHFADREEAKVRNVVWRMGGTQ